MRLSSFGHGHGHRLLDQHARTGIEKILGDLEVQRRRRHDAHGIDMAQQLAVIGIRGNTQFRRHRRARAGGWIGDPDQVGVRKARVFLRVKSAQIADTHHRRAYQGGASRRHLLRAR